jgi:hypothetical protein
MDTNSSEKTDRPTSERRSDTRNSVRIPGTIKFGPIGTELPCTVHDLTPRGAGLSVATTFGLPETFQLVIEGRGSRNCRVRWTDDRKIGVSFN